MHVARRSVEVSLACLLAIAGCAHGHRSGTAPSTAPPGVVDVVQYRLDLAQQARDQLRARWLARGAIPRPPMPPLLAEEPGEPPYIGARWVSGRWEWTLGRWQWRPGYWTEPDVFMAYDDPGVPDLVFGGAFAAGIGLSRPIGEDLTGVRDHRDRRGFVPAVRDHREARMHPAVRDHRDRLPAVRDHRKSKDKDTSSRGEHWTSSVLDERRDQADRDSKQDTRDTGGGGQFLRPH